MSTNYSPSTFAGGSVTATALTAEFANIKTALDACLQRINNTANQLEVTLDMNSNAIVNVAQGTDPTDVATLQDITDALGTGVDVGQLQDDLDTAEANITNLQNALAALQGSVTSLTGVVSDNQNTAATNQANITTLQGEVSTLQTDVATLQTQMTTALTNASTALTTANSAAADAAVALAAANDADLRLDVLEGAVMESLEFGTNTQNGTTPAGRFLVSTATTSPATLASAYSMDEGDFLNFRWDPSDTVDPSLYLGAGNAPHMLMDDGTNTKQYTLLNGDGTPLAVGNFAVGDAVRGFIATAAVENGAAGTIRLHARRSVNTRLLTNEQDITNNSNAITTLQGNVSSLTSTLSTVQTIATSNQDDIQNVLKRANIPVSLEGALADNTEVARIAITEDLTLIGAGVAPSTYHANGAHRGRAVTAPSGGAGQLRLKTLAGTTVCTIEYADGSPIAGFLTTAAVTFAAGDHLIVETLTLNGLESPWFTFVFERNV